MKNKLGFSLTELIITLIIVAILAIVAIPIYRGYVKKGIATEGKSLLGEINAAQQIYYTRHGQYFAGTSGTQISRALGVDARRNKYFTSWHVVTGGTNGSQFTAYANSTDGHALRLSGAANQTKAYDVVDNTNYAN